MSANINDTIDEIKRTVDVSIRDNVVPHNKIVNEAIDCLVKERLILVSHLNNIDAQLGALKTILISV